MAAGGLKGQVVNSYFDNLLPDSRAIRERLATRFGTASTDAFALLRAVGRDCVGAIQLLAEDEAPAALRQISGTPMSPAEVEALLLQTVTPGRPGGLPGDEDVLRISLAGAQEKTALLWHEQQWMRPHGATPTTHILSCRWGSWGIGRRTSAPPSRTNGSA
jgi:serine/threonine-protein kinase HipA